MSRRGFRVGCIAGLAMVFGVVGAQSPSSAATRRVDLQSIAAAKLRALAPTTAAVSDGDVHAHSLCWERDYTDPRGDAPVDAVAYRMTYDCQAARWTLSATLAAPATRTTLDSFEVALDVDGNMSNGCAGFDRFVLGVFDENSGAPIGGVLLVTNCTPSTWPVIASATFGLAGDRVTLSYGESALNNSARLSWAASLVTATGKFDALPDNDAVHVASNFLQQTGASDGYWLVDAAGGVHAYGNALFRGDLANVRLASPIVGMTRKPDRAGYWLLGRDGGVFTFGGASFYGSTGAIHLNRPVVSMAATVAGHGYWFVASDGGIFSFGDANFYGSTGAIHLNKPIVGMASTPSGKGYWLVATDGGIFSFGDARFYGSTGALRLASPIVGMTVSPTGHGYRFVAADGGIFAFGDARFLGGLGGGRPPSPVIGMA